VLSAGAPQLHREHDRVLFTQRPVVHRIRKPRPVLVRGVLAVQGA